MEGSNAASTRTQKAKQPPFAIVEGNKKEKKLTLLHIPNTHTHTLFPFGPFAAHTTS